MELVKKNGEEGFLNLLSVVQSNPSAWMSIHVNMAKIGEQMLKKEILSQQVLDEISAAGRRVASTLFNSRLDQFEGKIFMFEDSDVIALFKKDNGMVHREVLDTLRAEFTGKGLDTFLEIEEMKDRISSLIELSEAKTKSAELYRMKRRAIEVGEVIFSWAAPDGELIRSVQQKRVLRPHGSVLLVEDDIVTRGMVALGLRDKYEVVQAKDGRSGVTAYVDNAPDIVFLDLHLPDYSGLEVLYRLRMVDPKAHVVILSSDSVPSNVLGTREKGAAGFLRKPFSKDKILQAVSQCPTIAARMQADQRQSAS